MLYSQPQIGPLRLDYSEPLTAGLIQAHTGFGVVDAVAPSVLPTVTGQVIQRPDGLEFSAAPAGTARFALPHEKTNSFTILLIVKALGNASPFASHSGLMYDAAGNAPYGRQIDRTSAGNSIRFAFDAGGSAQSIGGTAIGAPNISTTQFDTIAATFTSGAQALYVNGVLIEAGSYTGNPSYTSTSVIGLGNVLGDGRNANVIVKAAGQWGRVLSKSEMDAWFANPWRLFEDPNGDDDMSYLRTVQGAAIAAPAGVTATASVGAAIARGAASASPAGVGAVVSVGSASASGAASAAPAGVSASASVGTAQAAGGAQAMPAGVTATASVGTATASAASVSVQHAIKLRANDMYNMGAAGLSTAWYKFEFAADFTIAQMIISSKVATGTPGTYMMQFAVTDEISVNTLTNAYVPKRAGVAYNDLSANGWQNATFGGATSKQIGLAPSAGNNSAASMISDALPLARIPRADGKPGGILLVKIVQIDAAGGFTTDNGTMASWDTARGVQPWFSENFCARRDNVNGITTLTALPTSVAETATGYSIMCCPVVTSTVGDSVMITGDSRKAAAWSSKVFNNPNRMAIMSLSTGARPISMVNASGSGHSQAQYLQVAMDLLTNGLKPTVIYIPGFSQNGFTGYNSFKTANDNFMSAVRALPGLANVKFVIDTDYFVSGYAGTANETARQQCIAYAKSLANGSTVFCFDSDAILTDYTAPATPVLKSALMNADGVHANQAGQDVLSYGDGISPGLQATYRTALGIQARAGDAPLGVTATATVGVATASGAARATPSGVGATANVGTATAQGGATASPAGVTATASVGQATATAGGSAVAMPAGVTATASVGAPTAAGYANVLVNGISAFAGVGTATARGAATAAPAGVSAQSSVGQATASGGTSIGATATPVGVSATASVGQATATGGASARPAGVGAVASVGQPVASGAIVIPATAIPLGVTAYARVGTATASGGVVYARAPAGSGYTPQRNEHQCRPANTQRNDR